MIQKTVSNALNLESFCIYISFFLCCCNITCKISKIGVYNYAFCILNFL